MRFIFEQLTQDVRNSHQSKVVQVLRVLACVDIPLDHVRTMIPDRSLLALFQQIIQSNPIEKDDEILKWECARLVLEIETRLRRYLYIEPSAEDSLLEFMEHEAVLLGDQGLGDHDGSFADAIVATGGSFCGVLCGELSRDRFVDGVCLALEPGQSLLVSNAGLKACLPAFLSDWNDHASLPKLSSALCQFWNRTPEDSRRAHCNDYTCAIYSLSSSESTSFHCFIIREHGEILDEITRNYGALHPFSRIIENVLRQGEHFLVTLLQQAGDHQLSAAWLRLVWRSTKDGDYEVSDEFGGFTADTIREGGSIVADLLVIFSPFISWVHSRKSSERVDSFADVVEVFLNHLWKQSGLKWCPNLSQILTLTMELYHRKGFGGMNPETHDSWLQFVWTHCDQVDEEIEEATVELFGRYGESTMEEYRVLVSLVQFELERVVEYAKIAKGTSDFKEGRYEELNRRLILRIQAKTLLEVVCERSRSSA